MTAQDLLAHRDPLFEVAGAPEDLPPGDELLDLRRRFLAARAVGVKRDDQTF